MKSHSKLSFAVIAAITSCLVFSSVTAGAADSWGRLNPFNTLPVPKWPEWATVKMPEVDLVPDWVKIPDVREFPKDIARIHNRNMNALGKAADYINPFKSRTVPLPPPPPTGSRKTRAASKSPREVVGKHGKCFLFPHRTQRCTTYPYGIIRAPVAPDLGRRGHVAAPFARQQRQPPACAGPVGGGAAHH